MSWRVHITWRMLLLVVWTGATGSNLIRLEWEMECGCTGMEVEAMALLMPLLTDPSFLVATNWCDEMCPGYPPTDLALIKGASKRKLKQVDMKVYHVAFRGVCATFHGEAGPRARVVVARAMSEVSGLDQEAVDRCNLPSTTQVWVPSQFNKDSFRNSGVHPDKLKLLPESIDLHVWKPGPSRRTSPASKPFVFLSVFKFEPRKNWKQLVESFLTEFSANEAVQLHIKTQRVPWLHEDPLEALQDFAADLAREGTVPDAQERVSGAEPQIRLTDTRLKIPELVELYREADAFVLASHGEGWGLPLLEAMAMGLPTIGTRWGGNTGFMENTSTFLIDVDHMIPPPDDMHGFRWALPSMPMLRGALRGIFTLREAAAAVGRQARERALHFSREQVGELLKALIRRALKDAPRHPEQPASPRQSTRRRALTSPRNSDRKSAEGPGASLSSSSNVSGDVPASVPYHVMTMLGLAPWLFMSLGAGYVVFHLIKRCSRRRGHTRQLASMKKYGL
eukprot:TRINITY_DN6920_c0_g1_i1.p1 TRINITY_DN6920_c0_g1~~TRINITY_DN6920_c0_g1_i1.p1  ORF type:complete len:508 (+),score=105.46 TRINITY_DN6920_c0_g1_i1:239-1762(+)